LSADRTPLGSELASHVAAVHHGDVQRAIDHPPRARVVPVSDHVDHGSDGTICADLDLRPASDRRFRRLGQLFAQLGRLARRLASASLLVGTITLAGCDLTGQYEKKFQEALQTAARQATFERHLQPDFAELMGADGKSLGVKLRLPRVFDSSTKTLKPSDPRAQPPFGDLLGLVSTRERPIDDAQGRFLPCYGYVAAVPKSSQKADALQAAIAKQVAAALAGANWSDATLTTPDGRPFTLKRLRGSGNQEFFDLTKNPPASTKIEGVFDLYLVDTPQAHVLIGWRCPKPQADKYDFLAATEAAMATLQVEAASGGDAPNP
jgi:hypothetical protein